jgi:hypothetical protein
MLPVQLTDQCFHLRAGDLSTRADSRTDLPGQTALVVAARSRCVHSTFAAITGRVLPNKPLKDQERRPVRRRQRNLVGTSPGCRPDYDTARGPSGRARPRPASGAGAAIRGRARQPQIVTWPCQRPADITLTAYEAIAELITRADPLNPGPLHLQAHLDGHHVQVTIC